MKPIMPTAYPAGLAFAAAELSGSTGQARFPAAGGGGVLQFCRFLSVHPLGTGVPDAAFAFAAGPVFVDVRPGGVRHHVRAYLSGKMAGGAAREIVTLGYVLMFAAAGANLAYNLLVAEAAMPWAVLPLALYTTGMSLAAPSITLNLMDQFPACVARCRLCRAFCRPCWAASWPG
jgi:hypothetical protein